jgi:hypothetical protein
MCLYVCVFVQSRANPVIIKYFCRSKIRRMMYLQHAGSECLSNVDGGVHISTASVVTCSHVATCPDLLLRSSRASTTISTVSYCMITIISYDTA